MSGFEEAFIALVGKKKTHVMKRPYWGTGSPYKYLWITSVGTLVVSVGNGNSAPPLMLVTDFLATDWEVIKRDDG
jgi:hypothetical protein